jgi:hypothetical protein
MFRQLSRPSHARFHILSYCTTEPRSLGTICLTQTSSIRRCSSIPSCPDWTRTCQVSSMAIQIWLEQAGSHAPVRSRKRSASSRLRAHAADASNDTSSGLGSRPSDWSDGGAAAGSGCNSSLVRGGIGITASLFAEIIQYSTGSVLVESSRTTLCHPW